MTSNQSQCKVGRWASKVGSLRAREGKILDGRNRYRACVELGIEPETTNYTGNDPVGFSLSLNLHRRHLTSDQRAAIAVDVLPLYEAEAKKRQKQAGEIYGRGQKVSQSIEQPIKGKATDHAARFFDTNRQYISDLKRIKQEDPDTFEAIKKGEKRLAEVKREAQKFPVVP